MSTVVTAISQWVNDQFETANPVELAAPPHTAHLRHFATDPNSGVSGLVYLALGHVYYQGFGPNEPWWDLGPLPDDLMVALRDAGHVDASTRAGLGTIAQYFINGGEPPILTFASLAGINSNSWVAQDGAPMFQRSGARGTVTGSPVVTGTGVAAGSSLGYTINLADGTLTMSFTDMSNAINNVAGVLFLVERTLVPGETFLFHAIEPTSDAYYPVRIALF